METDVDTPGTGEPLHDPAQPSVSLKKVRGAVAQAGGPAAAPGEAPSASARPTADDPRFLPAHLDPTAPTVLPPHGPIEHSRGWRRWLLRAFIVTLLLAAAGTIAMAAAKIVQEQDGPQGRRSVNGVLMPDDGRFRDITNQLLARKRPEKLTGITVVGAAGTVTIIRYKRGQTSFLSSYLNPNALQVIGRAIGARSDESITVNELRLEVLRRTGRQRWRLNGTKAGKPWRATVNPNGTNLRLIPTG